MPDPVRLRAPARTLRTTIALMLAGLCCLGAGIDPASASASTQPRETSVTIQSRILSTGHAVRSIRIGSVGRATGAHCVDLPDPTPPEYGWRRTDRRLYQDVYEVVSFSVPGCRLGFGMAGSHGYIDTRRGDRWTVYGGIPPKRNA